ncbi:MAG: TonB-dependent receptor [Saprospirales bacterium]|nr:TonB-dependent receptor [Saprospirales bacterium]
MMNHRYLLIFTIAFSFSLKIIAQNSLSGTVTDESGQPIIGANIFFPDLKTGTTTDLDGHYEVQHLPAKKMLVQVSYVGYNTLTKTIDIQGAVTMDFVLEEAHLEAREVVVTGLSVSQEKRRSPVSIDVLKKDFLLQNGGTNLVDALTEVAGVSAIGTGPGISKPIIRGLGYNRVLVVQDGIRQEGQQWGDEHGLEIDGNAVERVEIFRGPASLMYGSDGLGGVIHIESPHPVMKGTIAGSVNTAYQTNNSQREVSGFLAANANGWNGYLIGTLKKADDYQNAYDGKVFNSGFEERNASGMLGVNRKWGYSHVHFSSFFQQPQLPEGERNPDGSFVTDEAPYQEITHHKVGWNNNFIFRHSSLKTVIGFQQNIRKEFEEPDVAGLVFDMKTLTYDLKHFIVKSEDWEFTYGFSGMVQDSKNKGEEYLVPDYSVNDLGGFAYARHPLEQWELSAGIRYDNRSFSTDELVEDGETRFAALDRNFGNVSGSIGLGWFPSEKTAVKLNLARGFRSPNVAELASNGVHEGTFRYELGNDELEAETNFEIDAGFDLDLKHITLTANPFFNSISNYIYLEKLASVNGGDSLSVADGELFPTFKFTQGKAQLWGGEFSIDIHPHPYDWLHFKNTVSVVLAKQLNSENEHLPFIPPAKYQMELRADLPLKSTAIRNSYVEINLDYFYRQHRILSANDFETTTPGYALMNGSLGFDLGGPHGKTLAKFAFIAQNIFDKAYQYHLSRLKYAPENPATGRRGIFNMGRNFVLKLTVPFEGRIRKK